MIILIIHIIVSYDQNISLIIYVNYMDPMSGFGIRLVFTLPPSDSILQYKRCVHLWNNFPCIKSLAKIKDDLKLQIIYWVTKDTRLSCWESEYKETDRMNSYSRLWSLILCGIPVCYIYYKSFMVSHWRAQNKSYRTTKLSISSSYVKHQQRCTGRRIYQYNKENFSI